MSKYVIFKEADWEAYLNKVGNEEVFPPHLFTLIDREITDGEVIRGQDITSAPIFYAYSSIIRSYMELMDQTSVFHRGSEIWENLERIADHFYDAAITAEKNPNKKLPT